jgi:hypothetical protein
MLDKTDVRKCRNLCVAELNHEEHQVRCWKLVRHHCLPEIRIILSLLLGIAAPLRPIATTPLIQVWSA